MLKYKLIEMKFQLVLNFQSVYISVPWVQYHGYSTMVTVHRNLPYLAQ